MIRAWKARNHCPSDRFLRRQCFCACAALISWKSTRVVKLNQQLEQRVADQVGKIERMSRLRRFLPPQVTDLIVASGSEK